VAAHGQRLRRDFFDASERGRLGLHIGEEAIEQEAVPLDFDEHFARPVEDEAAEPRGRGQAIDEGPKADPLHDTLNRNGTALEHGGLSRLWRVGEASALALGRVALLPLFGFAQVAFQALFGFQAKL
jgi:hypothetical protein